MPEFVEHSKNMEDGWSKPTEDDLVEWEFKTDFPAFKFPDRDVLHLTCGIQLCNGRCPKVCSSDLVESNFKVSHNSNLISREPASSQILEILNNLIHTWLELKFSIH